MNILYFSVFNENNLIKILLVKIGGILEYEFYI